MADKKNTRWELLGETSPSGKALYKCTQCGRKSYTPDKWCGVTCGDQLEHVKFLQGECNHLLREFSDANTEARTLRAENERLQAALKFYAEKANWSAIPNGRFVYPSSVKQDGGYRAREALGASKQ